MKHLSIALIALVCLIALPLTATARQIATQNVDLGDGYWIVVPADWTAQRVDNGAYTLSGNSLTVNVTTPVRLRLLDLTYETGTDVSEILVDLALPFNGVQIAPETIQRATIGERKVALYVNTSNEVVDQIYAVIELSDGGFGYMTITCVKGVLQAELTIIQGVIASLDSGFVPTATPVIASATPTPTEIIPTAVSTATPIPTDAPTATPIVPTEVVVIPTDAPTATPIVPTAVPSETAVIPTSTDTPLPTATDTPLPTTTDTPIPTSTDTPLPTATDTPIPTSTDTPIPTATDTPLPTDTPTPTPTPTIPTDTPTSTNTPEPCTVSTEIRNSAHLRVGPGTNRGVISYLPTNVRVTVTGRVQLPDGSIWYQLDKAQAAPEGTEAAELWVSAESVTASGDCANVGIAATPPIIRRATATPEGGESTSEPVSEATTEPTPEPIIEVTPETTAEATSRPTTAPTTPPTAAPTSEQPGNAIILPANGTWTMILNTTANSSCEGGTNVERPSSEVFTSLNFSAALRVLDDNTFSYGGDVYIRAPESNTFVGAFSLSESQNTQAWLTLTSRTTIFGQVTNNYTQDGTACSATVAVLISRN